MKKLKSYDYTLITFILVSLALIPFFYKASIIRLVDSVRDLGLSVAYYFCAFLDKEIAVSVIEMPSLDILDYLPYDFDEIFRRLKDMWSVVFNPKCFLAYVQKIALWLRDFSMIFMLLAPLVFLGWFVIRITLLSPNLGKHGVKSNHVIRFENKSIPKLKKIGCWFTELFKRFKAVKWYSYSIVIIWAVNLNIACIAIEFVAYYFYFAMSQDIINIFKVQAGKLILDVVIMLSGAPLVFWLVITYVLLFFWRRSVGFKRLKAVEKLNRAFINEQPICIMLCGLMGSKKTTMLTDMALSQEMMFRDKALEKILEIDSMFPNFPWVCFEDELKRAFYYHEIYSLTTARDYVAKKQYRFRKTHDPKHIYYYDFDKYRVSIDNELEVYTIWKALEEYAQLYLIYIIQSSLLVSNYSVRVDNVLEYAGNFPLWNSDFFKRSPELSDSLSRHAHILDYDSLRLGTQMLKDNPNRANFEFGVVLISEMGKERGNSLTTQELKKNDEKCNQKNDLFNYWIKMIRHKGCTVANVPFVRLIADEQRPESIGADARDLFYIVYIRKSNSFRLVMPFFFVTELLHDLLYPHFQTLYVNYRYNRGDTSFVMYALHNIFSAFHNFYLRNYNLFGVAALELELERGTQDGELQEVIYYLSSKKVYSNRFKTDCYKQFYETTLRNSPFGLDDYPEYSSTQPTAEEFEYQNSFFIQDMDKIT